MRDERLLSALIAKVYDAAMQPAAWQPFLSDLCDLLDARAASVHVVDPIKGNASLFVEHGTDPKWTALLLSKYAAMSPIGGALLLSELDEPITAFDFVSESEFVDSVFYREWCQPQGYYDMMGAIIAKRPTEVGAVSVTRLLEKPRFGPHDRDRLRLLAPHVRRAVEIAGLLEHRAVEAQALRDLMDQLAVAVFLVDDHGVVIRTNPAAEAMLATGNGGAIRSGGRLMFTDKDADAALAMELAGVSGRPATIPLRGHASVDNARARLSAAVLPLGPAGKVFAVMLHAPGPTIPASGKLLSDAFGMTPREIAVLMPLLDGRTPAEVAAQLGVSLATVRTHLQRLLSKTGTTRQTDMMRVVLQALPPIKLNERD